MNEEIELETAQIDELDSLDNEDEEIVQGNIPIPEDSPEDLRKVLEYMNRNGISLDYTYEETENETVEESDDDDEDDDDEVEQSTVFEETGTVDLSDMF